MGVLFGGEISFCMLKIFILEGPRINFLPLILITEELFDTLLILLVEGFVEFVLRM